ncbi:MAG: aminotransferase class V-fold PLP-dependent enzyme [Burkholderiaceae bacterium]|jgi:alanine-glyoxylate transaminase/serine-glyoxylate transaminase/serine-pyruvate transaminase|nr:aminotransferase class V-fold PLP-dependent enzyme [Burkholderiaceae bacterium]MCZ8175796.1 aminotransferase class V-fold PLP-dependent enzyme [Burkholderiaceae bacterium]
MTAPAPRIPGHRLLHAPGPSPIPDEVLHAMSVQNMDLADPRVDASIAACEAGLRTVLGTGAATRVLMFIANGHGVWESVVQNLAAPGQAVLVPGTGHFADQWARVAEALGREVVRTPWHEGFPIDAAAVAAALRDDTAHRIRVVFAVHTDTASGVTSDLAALRRAIDGARHPALLVADCVASLACEPIGMDALGLDVVIGASQKGLMCPPGLGIVAVNEAAFEAARANPAPRFYWDWVAREGPMNYQKFCGTPPLPLLHGLAAALALLQREGLPAVYARHRRLAGAVHAAVAGWAEGGALGFVAREPATRSVSVTAIRVPEGFDVNGLRTLARERFQVAMAGGLGALQGRAFRIGHLGDQNEANILGALAGVECALRAMNVPLGDGVGRAVRLLAG